jgi:preprotein translocase subunit SecY
MPDVLLFEMNVPQRIAIFFGGTGMLITVGVVLDTMRRLRPSCSSVTTTGS